MKVWVMRVVPAIDATNRTAGAERGAAIRADLAIRLTPVQVDELPYNLPHPEFAPEP